MDPGMAVEETWLGVGTVQVAADDVVVVVVVVVNDAVGIANGVAVDDGADGCIAVEDGADICMACSSRDRSSRKRRSRSRLASIESCRYRTVARALCTSGGVWAWVDVWMRGCHVDHA